MGTIRKDFKFKTDTDGQLVCNFLELLGRKQSKFITDLVLRFLKENGISSTDSMSKEQARALAQNGIYSDAEQFNKMLRYLVDHGVQFRDSGTQSASMSESISPISKFPEHDTPMEEATSIRVSAPVENEEFEDEDDMSEENAKLGEDILTALGMFNQ